MVEYDIFFSDFIKKGKSSLRQQLPKATSAEDTTAKCITDPKYGIWDQELLEKNGWYRLMHPTAKKL